MARGEIRYFLDYVKSNEIILEEKKKRFERLTKDIDNFDLHQALLAVAIAMVTFELMKIFDDSEVKK